jgi:hypothetical protein
MSYCTRADVYALGLGPEAFARPPRLVEGVVAASATVQLSAHGLSADQPITLSVQSGGGLLGMAASSLPGGLVEGVTYYAQPLSGDTFQLSTAPSIAPIASFLSGGVGVFGVFVDHGPALDAAITEADALLDAHLTAHKGPVTAPVVRGVAARISARIYVGAHGLGNPVYAKAYESVEALRIMDERLMQGWYAGRPLPAGATDASPTVPEMGAVLVTLADRGFNEREDNRV